MIYAPYILQRKAVLPPQLDEFGRVVAVNTERWEAVCHCRCDDDTTTELISPNGSVYRSKFHVVCEGGLSLKEGDIIRCMDGNEERGEGVIGMIKRTNYLSYTEVWL